MFVHIRGKKLVTKLRVLPPDNWRKAKCKDTVIGRYGDPDFYDPFFDDQEEAVRFCNGTDDGNVCPIRHECLIYALTNNEKWGTFGGTSEITRKAIRKKFPAQRNKEPNPDWEWMSEEDALEGLDRSELQKELDKEQGSD